MVENEHNEQNKHFENNLNSENNTPDKKIDAPVISYTKVCPRCNITFNTKIKRKKFCSEKCRSSYFSSKGYYAKRDDPEYKEKRRIRFQKYLSNPENRLRWNEQMKKITLKYLQKKKNEKCKAIT